jgi:hypothetical protein
LVIIFSFSTFKKSVFGISINILQLSDKLEIFLENKVNLVEENKKLLGEVVELKNQKNILDFYKIENNRLKEELGYREVFSEKRHIFNIINSSENFFKNILLIRDQEKKVKKNDLVFSNYNLLIGKIDQRIGDNVNIKLYSEVGEKNIFFLSDGGKNILIVEALGFGGGILKVVAPRGISFENPEKVFLVHPSNTSFLVASKVDEVFEVQDANSIIYFKLLVNPFLLSRVEILNLENGN